MSDNFFFSVYEGVAIPIAKVDLLRWLVDVRKNYEINYHIPADGTPEFDLLTETVLEFKQNCFYAGHKEPMLTNIVGIRMEKQIEPLLSSELFNSLSEKASSKLQETLGNLVKYSSRVKAGEESMAQLQNVIDSEQLKNNPTYLELRKKLKSRMRHLQEAEANLLDFTQSKSKPMHENLKITEARELPEWNEEIEANFEHFSNPNYDTDEDELNGQDFDDNITGRSDDENDKEEFFRSVQVLPDEDSKILNTDHTEDDEDYIMPEATIENHRPVPPQVM